MNVRKRGLALLMCICMIFTLLPFSVLADNGVASDAEPPVSVESSGDNGVKLKKTVTKQDDDTYKVTLEQYVTGTVTQGKVTPIDVVLVLDVSGSMDDPFNSTTYVPTFKTEKNWWKTYYVLDSNDNYKDVSWCDECSAFTNGCEWNGWKHTKAGVAYTPKSSKSDTATGVVQFYQQQTTSASRISALKSAVNRFIDTIAKDNSDSNIAIVKFAGKTTDDVGDETYKDGIYTYNYTQIVKELTPVKTGASDLKTAVNKLSAAGATSADYGLEKAKKVFDKTSASDGRQRVVIMFTDGQPNHHKNFDPTVANDAISNANTLKSAAYGAKVYTIGIFSGASIGTSLPEYNNAGRTNRYMHLVSSNYPNATDLSKPGKDGAVTNGYYKVAANADELSKAFTDIGDAEGTPDITLGSTAVLTDVVAGNFKAPANANEVKLYTAAYNGTTNEFAAPVPITDTNVKAEISGQNVTVTGFDYSANFVSDTEKNDGTYGKKLIVEFTITVDRTKTYGGTQPTNAGANIKLGDDVVASVDNPKVPVSIDYEFKAIADKTKTYDGSGFDIGAEIGGMLTNNPPVGTKNGHVTITYTITDSDGKKIGTYTILAGQATGTWQAAEGVTDTTTPADAGEYTYKVTCTMSDAYGSAAEKTATGTAKFVINKRSVTLTSASDSKVYDGTALTNDTVTVTGDGFVEGEGATYNVTGSQTDVGESDNEFTYTLNEGTKAANYEIKTFKGNLKVTPITDEVVVTITGNHDRKLYNGKEQSVTGFTTDVGDKDITVALKEGSKAEAKGTDVNKYDMGLTAGDFTVTSKNYSNIKVVVVDGYLDITPIMTEVTVKITGNNKTVTYNGKEQKVEGYDYTVTEGIDKSQITVALIEGKTAEAKGINPDTYYMGLSKETFTVASKNYGNIAVIVEDGWLKINRRPMPPVNPGIGDEITVEITGNSDSVVYDGTEHSVKGYTVKISDPRYTEADFTFTGKAEASGVNAGTYEMGLKAEQFKNTNARFTNVKFVIKADGVLTITPKDLTITAGSKTEYGPTPVTCDEWTVSGLVAGDKVESVKITGIQSVPGSSPNVPSDAVIKNAKGEDVTKNYAIKYVNGTLTMLEVLNKEDHFNYIIGTPEGLSLPTANVTRAEVATIFFRLMTDDARAKFDSLDNNFSDVAKGKWYNRAISTLAKAGIIKGDPAGTYRPGDPITRAEMAAIIARFGDFKEGGKTFNDISGHWAQKYIELAASNGWINGNPDGTFKPNNNITRAETVAMINRVLDRQTKDVSDLLPVAQMTNWSDNMDTAKWYYRDMQEATNNHKAERVGNSIYEKWTEKLPDIDWASYQI